MVDEVSTVDVKPLGKTGEKIPAIGIGTRGIHDYRLAEEAMVYAFELGLRVVEVSDEYGEGLAETLVGRVIKKFKRDEVFVILRLNSNRFSDADSAVSAVSNSLKRLMVTYVDVVLLDGLNDVLPIDVQIKVLRTLIDKGLSRYIGLSNFRLKDVLKALEILPRDEVVMLQAKYNVLDRRVEKDLLKFAIENNITFAACSPLDRGNVKKHQKLIYLSSKYNKTPIQIALNYVISKPQVIATPKSENKQHIEEISKALGWRLSTEDIRFLSSA